MQTIQLEFSVKTDMEPLWPEIENLFLQKVDILIRKNISNNYFGAAELSNELGISSSQLNRQLNQSLGLTAGKLIREKRLEYARKLIEDTNLALKNIGVRVAYLEQANFTRAFVKEFGVTPSSLRDRSKKKSLLR